MSKRDREIILEEIDRLNQEILKEKQKSENMAIQAHILLTNNVNFRLAELHRELDYWKVELSDVKH